uniref:Uncharacterized protein n=1 Tax=Setaria italica TaxID=4555 RepID=K3ZPD2_SETIT
MTTAQHTWNHLHQQFTFHFVDHLRCDVIFISFFVFMGASCV